MAFVFSCDGHVVEPSDLFEKNLSPSLLRHGVRSEIKDGMLTSYAGERITMRRPLDAAPRLGPDGEQFGRPDRRGNRELDWRKKDMELDGVDAEILFPSIGLTAFMIENPEAELATAQVYNDWHHELAKDETDTFVRCGIVPVAEADLPVVLPEVEDYAPRGRSPLAAAEDWVRVECPSCGHPALRETDTMDTFVDSSWYFYRYLNPHKTDGPFDPAAVSHWFPIDLYVGGIEHAILHLVYSRFWTKMMRDPTTRTCSCARVTAV